VTGRGRTCDAPRFKRALYRMSYGRVSGQQQLGGGLHKERGSPPSAALIRPSVQRPRGSSTHARYVADDDRVSYLIVAARHDLVHATRSPFDPGSLAGGTVSYVEGSWSPVHIDVTENGTR
jgi:hypothetical protein